MDKYYRKNVFLGDAYFKKNMFFRGSQVFGSYGKMYFVDSVSGLDTNDGLSWANAVKTIAKAIEKSNLTRTLTADNWIIIAPGTYAESIETLPFACHMIGLGFPGTDKAVEIHPAEGPALAGTVSGLHLYNIRFECHGAVDLLDFNICNNVTIENCQLCPASASVKNAISTESSSWLTVRNCRFSSGSWEWTFDCGIYAAGGANKFFHNAVIENNIIEGLKAAGKGIFMSGECVNDMTTIRNNIIKLSGAGTGIDDSLGGSAYQMAHVIGNYVFHVGGTAYTIKAAFAAQNIANDNGVVTCVPEITWKA